jgi:hypothetical protein
MRVPQGTGGVAIAPALVSKWSINMLWQSQRRIEPAATRRAYLGWTGTKGGINCR